MGVEKSQEAGVEVLGPLVHSGGKAFEVDDKTWNVSKQVGY